MRATELGNRVVTVFGEHPVIEILGALQLDDRVGAVETGSKAFDSDLRLVIELVEEETADRLGGATVPGEKGALDDLRKVDHRKDRSIEIGKKARQNLSLVVGEFLDVKGHWPPICERAHPTRGEEDRARLQIRSNLRDMVAIRAFIVALIAAAVAVALIPLMVLLDLRRGGTGWGLCGDGLSDCRTSYFDGFELIAWLFAALFILLGMIAASVRILRYLEQRQDETPPAIFQ
jgi:hypothetical protein